jgi:hypothetical protein
MQDAIKALKIEGAKPEELGHLRKGLTGLHSALARNDHAAAHEALTQLQHGFYHAHTSFQTEHGGGSFPLIGTKEMLETAMRANSRAADAADWRDAQTARRNAADGDLAGVPSEVRSKIEKEEARGLIVPTKPKQDKYREADSYRRPDKPAAMRDADEVAKRIADDAMTMFKDFVAASTKVGSDKTQPVVVNLTLPSQGVTLDQRTGVDTAAFRNGLEAVLDKQKDLTRTIVVPAPQVLNKVDVSPTPVKFEATVVTPEPKVPTMPDIHVNVNPTPVTVQNNVEAKPGEVKVVADVQLPNRSSKPRSVEFQTDKDGKLTGATITEK